MSRVVWDAVGERKYSNGVDRGMLYKQNANGEYGTGVAWNGLTAVTEKPSGAEEQKQYADNIKYLSLLSAEDFGLTIEAFFSPEEFDECDGCARIANGVSIAQQARRGFAFSYRSMIGTDASDEAGYEIHVVYGCKASPTEKARNTKNESPEAPTLSWEVTTTPIPVPGFKPTAHLWVNTINVNDETKITELENILYGTDAVEADVEHNIEAQEATVPTLAMPADFIRIFGAPTNAAG